MDKVKLGTAMIFVCRTREELALCLAQRFIELAGESISKRGHFTVALSGGSTPASLYTVLSDRQHKVDWSKSHLFWGDERCVAHDSLESNYKMAFDSLIARINIPSENIHATAGQEKNPEKAAQDYEATIRRFFSLGPYAVPQFDLILLGLGSDGHTASLFPGTQALADKDHLVVANYVDKLKAHRITFTLPVLNSASHVIFMVSGQDKKEILPQVLVRQPLFYPAQLVYPETGSLEWFVDQAASANLTSLNTK